MKVCVITATKGRHSCLERSVKCFLDQTYTNSVQLIYNNHCDFQRLNNNLPKDRFVLVNNCLSKKTNKPYTTLGEIYNDAITYVPEDCDVISFWDDDDLFLPLHIEEGVRGLERGGKLAYKPKKSYYSHSGVISLMENTMEPSIFVKKEHILKHGFSEETSAQHLKWVDALIRENQIYVDENGMPTLIYMWGDYIPVFKTSGDPNNPNNFKNYENFSKDIGDGIITPVQSSPIPPRLPR